jgi:metal-sulfur cluster biosynthetic enzyme
MSTPTRKAVYDRLDTVTDPELDRPLTTLGFVDEVEVEGQEVAVVLRLPTGLCSPVFAWMMVSDAKEAVKGLPDVDTAHVSLDDHLFDDQITAGVNSGRTFDEQFEDAESGPEQVRRKLDWKACLARQFEVIEALREQGVAPEAIVEARRGDATVGPDGATIELASETVSLPGEILSRYLERATTFDLASVPSDPLFVDQDGEPIAAASFDRVRRRLRAARVNRDNQGHRCELLLESRYDADDGVGSAGVS